MINGVFGEALRRLRTERGLSLRKLASQLNYSHSYVTEIERGIKPGTVDVAERCDEVLGTNGYFAALITTDRREEREVAWASTSSREVATVEEVMMAAEESARFIYATGRPLTRDVLDQLEADVVRLAEDYLRQSPYAMFRPLATRRREVFELLDSRPRPEHASDLYRIAGRLSALLAHLSSDLGHPREAETHTRTAWLCADMSGDDTQRSYIRWIEAQVAYWQGNFHRSAQLAAAARVEVPRTDAVLRLSSQEARAHAAAGDAPAAIDALRDARTALADPPPEDEPGVFAFPAGKAAYYAAETYLALGEPTHVRAAVACAEDAVTLLDETPHTTAPELIAAARLDLAAACIASDDLDRGGEQIAHVLRLPTESRTVPITERAAKLAGALTAPRYADSLTATDCREQIDVFRAHPASRDLPALPE